MEQSAFNQDFDIRLLVARVMRHARGAWRYRLTAAIAAWLFLLLGVVFVYTLPDNYRAQTRVFVDTESLLRPLLDGLSVETDVMNDVALMTRVLLSKPQLKRVAQETDLDLEARTPVQMEGLLNSLEDRISVQGEAEGIYAISFEDTERDVALNVVNKLLESFVEDTLGTKREDSQQAERTLKRELDDYERRLVESEDRLKAFKQRNVGLMPGDGGDYYQQLQEALAELEAVQAQISITRREYATLQRQVEGEEPVFGIMRAGGGPQAALPEDAEIVALQTRLSELLVNYTEKHPEVVRTQSRLEELLIKRQNTPVASVATTPGMSLEENPVYQRMRVMLTETEVELASLNAQLDQRQSTVDELRKLVDVIPEVEAELGRLNRDYTVVKARYEQMLSRWENLQTSKRVRSGMSSVQFRVIEPPFSETAPIGPPRELFLLGALIVSIGIGAGLAVLLDILNPRFLHPVDLSLVGLPVLGFVSFAQKDEDVRKARLKNLAFTVSVAALFTFAVLAVAVARPAASFLSTVL